VTVRELDIKIKFVTKSKDKARIIHDSMNPDNCATPPVKITSTYVDDSLEVKVKGISTINTANATIIDILDSYNLNDRILRKIDDII
jgi:hypothetical protein